MEFRNLFAFVVVTVCTVVQVSFLCTLSDIADSTVAEDPSSSTETTVTVDFFQFEGTAVFFRKQFCYPLSLLIAVQLRRLECRAI